MLSALAFLTILGGARPPDRHAFAWFPLVGAGIGAVMAAVWWAAQLLWPPEAAAAILVAVDLALTGALHVDGLADCADGLLPHLDRDRRLGVMRQPDVGAFALAVVPVVLLARWAALATGQIQPLALVGIWATSRTIIATVPSFVPYARESGIATAFIAGSRRSFAGWLIPAAAIVVIAEGAIGIAAAFTALAAAAAVVVLAIRRIGGFTGDVLGASVVMSETAALLALVVRP
ncbi:MAG TPA: adenosylcobinamide-GDP ribazoletransferase [Acidimicrobiia bacterium]|nr:adenosylcobinamide-GDP ribazoletransferase [Acidimicrobiia bacterium]